MNYTLGLDIGIASIGWAVLKNNEQGLPCKIEDLGVRIFEAAEHPKTGASLALPRRQARGTRRCIRRRQHRKERIKNLIEAVGLMKKEDMSVLFENSGFAKDVYDLRAEALNRVLTADEWVRVLIHLSQRRGYQSNSKAEETKDAENGVLKAAIADNQTLMAEKGYRTVGEMFCRDAKFQTLGADGKFWRTTRNTSGDYKFTVTRQMVSNEVAHLFASQRCMGNPFVGEEFEQKYSEILFSQRNFDEGPGGESPYRQMDLRGYCRFEKEERRAFKACYTFEHFKLLQDLNHIRIRSKDDERELLPEERERIIALAMKSENLNFLRLRKELSLTENTYFNLVRYNKETAELSEKNTKFTQMQSYHKIRKALDRISKGYIDTLSRGVLDDIGTILSLYKADSKRISALRAIGLDEPVITQLLPLSFSKAGNLSLTAMQKLIPELEKGNTYDKACKNVYGEFQGHTVGVRRKTISLNPEFLAESGLNDKITNPVVLRAISQTCKVVNAIVRKYGSPQMIRLELAREMSKNHDERIKAEKSMEENRKKNENAMEHIREIKRDYATGLDLVKWKLYQEQDGICLYSGTHLDVSRLFKSGYVDIDHIIPYSISFDDSYRNKVLVRSSENRQKGNRLPLQYMENNPQKAAAFETLVETRIRDYRKRQNLLKKNLTDEDRSGFRRRNLNDTQYITRTVYNLFRDYLEFAPSINHGKEQIMAVNGAVTDYMRKQFGLHKNRADGDKHHAMDAAVIAVTTDAMIQRISNYAKRREWGQKVQGQYVDPEYGELLSQADFDEKYAPTSPEPWPQYRRELEARMGDTPMEDLERLHLPTYDPDEEVRPIFVSQMPRRKVTGAAHLETIWSKKEEGSLIRKVPLIKLKLDTNGKIKNYYRPGDDPRLYDALQARLMEYNGDAAKAFSEPFHKPKKDGTPGPVVNKVKIQEKTTKNIEVNGGIAGNSSMVRVDVYHVPDDGFYFIPIYVVDTASAALPQKAAVEGLHSKYWKEMDDNNFVFSLYPGDLIFIKSKQPLTLSKKNSEASGDNKIYRDEALLYFKGADINTTRWEYVTHDRKYEGRTRIKNLLDIQKFEVDELGNCHRVSQPEKRQSFR